MVREVDRGSATVTYETESGMRVCVDMIGDHVSVRDWRGQRVPDEAEASDALRMVAAAGVLPNEQLVHNGRGFFARHYTMEVAG